MAGRITNADIHAILNNRFGAVALPAPPTFYWVGLSTTAPLPDGTGATEPVGNGYTRVSFQNIAANWNAAANRVKSNAVPVTFPTAAASWGMITHFLMWDLSAAGVLRAYGVLDTPVEVTAGQTRSFTVGSLVIVAPGT